MNYFIFFFKKSINFLRKYIFELYIEFFNLKFLKLSFKNIRKQISIIKNILNFKLKINENFIW